MVVDPVYRYNGRVAQVRSNNGRRGYLYVKIFDAPWSDGQRDIGVDFNVVLRKEEDSGNWEFSDRADPDPDDAREELSSGLVEWFGIRLTVLRWLDEHEAHEVVSAHFA